MTYFRLTKIPPQLTLHTLAACASFHHDLCWPKNSVDVQSVVTLIEIICRLALVLNLQVTRFTWRPSISSPFSLCIVFHPMPFPVRNQHIDRNSFVCINYTYAVAMCVCVCLLCSFYRQVESHRFVVIATFAKMVNFFGDIIRFAYRTICNGHTNIA